MVSVKHPEKYDSMPARVSKSNVYVSRAPTGPNFRRYVDAGLDSIISEGYKPDLNPLVELRWKYINSGKINFDGGQFSGSWPNQPFSMITAVLESLG
jgi:hypothetical protein